VESKAVAQGHEAARSPATQGAFVGAGTHDGKCGTMWRVMPRHRSPQGPLLCTGVLVRVAWTGELTS
jgi:hypothetical protein